MSADTQGRWWLVTGVALMTLGVIWLAQTIGADDSEPFDYVLAAIVVLGGVVVTISRGVKR